MDENKVTRLVDYLAAKDIAEFEYSDSKLSLKFIFKIKNESMDESKSFEKKIDRNIENQIIEVSDTIFDKKETNVNAFILGTFYESSSPEEPPFVKIGSRVKKGEILGLIESMKVFTEIECPVDGEVVDILKGNGDFVEYDETLFKIKED